jgi:hypothetical protein
MMHDWDKIGLVQFRRGWFSHDPTIRIIGRLSHCSSGSPARSARERDSKFADCDDAKIARANQWQKKGPVACIEERFRLD